MYLNQRIIQNTCNYVFVLLITAMVSLCYAGEQVVSFIPEELSILSGESSELQLHYDVLSGDKGTTGLTLRIHYNSKCLESVKFEDMYGEGMLGQDYDPKDDIKDFDNDPSTDKFLCIGWVGMMGKWPAIIPPPLSLGKMIVTARKDIASKESSINVSATSIATGFSLVAKKATILIP